VGIYKNPFHWWIFIGVILIGSKNGKIEYRIDKFKYIIYKLRNMQTDIIPWYNLAKLHYNIKNSAFIPISLDIILNAISPQCSELKQIHLLWWLFYVRRAPSQDLCESFLKSTNKTIRKWRVIVTQLLLDNLNYVHWNLRF